MVEVEQWPNMMKLVNVRGCFAENNRYRLKFNITLTLGGSVKRAIDFAIDEKKAILVNVKKTDC